MGKKLKAYWVRVSLNSYCEPDPAVLVFAHSSREAKKVAYRETELKEYRYIDLRPELVKENSDYYLSFADKKKLENGIPHCAVNVPFCQTCGAYLNPDGMCPLCAECKNSPI